MVSVAAGGRHVKRPEGTVRLVIVSDTHEKHDLLSMPPGDVLIHCGDSLMLNWGFTNRTSLQKLQSFNRWLSTLPYKEKVVIGGNHDSCFEDLGKQNVSKVLSSCHYLENDYLLLECGLRVFGCPASQPNTTQSRNIAFQYTEEYTSNIFDHLVPKDLDILILHGPLHTLPPAERYGIVVL